MASDGVVGGLKGVLAGEGGSDEKMLVRSSLGGLVGVWEAM